MEESKTSNRTSGDNSEAIRKKYKDFVLDLSQVSIPISYGFTGNEGIDMYGGSIRSGTSFGGLQYPHMVRKGGGFGA